jgi:transposase-like protein
LSIDGVAPNQLFGWRRQAASGALTATRAGGEVDAASAYRALENQGRGRQRMNKQPATIAWLNYNGSCYTARETRRFAREFNLRPRTTPIESP